MGRPAALLKTPWTVRGMRGAAVPFGAAVPAATGTRRLAGPRREAQDELGCGERGARPSGAPAGSICAALREALKAATVLIEGDDPRIKHCRASHLAACGHTVLPKIGPVIALRRQTDYQFSPNWRSGAEDELSQPRFR